MKIGLLGKYVIPVGQDKKAGTATSSGNEQ